MLSVCSHRRKASRRSEWRARVRHRCNAQSTHSRCSSRSPLSHKGYITKIMIVNMDTVLHQYNLMTSQRLPMIHLSTRRPLRSQTADRLLLKALAHVVRNMSACSPAIVIRRALKKKRLRRGLHPFTSAADLSSGDATQAAATRNRRSPMTDAVIVSTARTPIGKAYRGALNATEGATLLGHAIGEAVAPRRSTLPKGARPSWSFVDGWTPRCCRTCTSSTSLCVPKT
jgi:hypothetical protein